MKVRVTRYSVVLVTASSVKEAEKVALTLLKSRLAACVNIVPKIKSHYWWKGRLERASESLLIIKTQTSLVKKITARVQAVHSYTVPEVLALPVSGGNPDYIDWLKQCLIGKERP
jgi:periplasmic divalent cation tolerance protein